MKLTEVAIERFRSAIKERPLDEEEIRRVPGMGHLFVSRKLYLPDENGVVEIEDGVKEHKAIIIDGVEYVHQYNMKIDGIKYYFYAGFEQAPQTEEGDQTP